MKSLLITVVFFLLSQIAFASPIELAPCSEVGANLENMLFGNDHQKSYYNGNVGLVVYDTVEPAAASYGIAIVHNEPSPSPEGFIVRSCLAVPYLSGVDLKNAKSSYNSKTGLTVIVPVRKIDPETGDFKDAKISIHVKTINTQTISEGHEVTAKEIK